MAQKPEDAQYAPRYYRSYLVRLWRDNDQEAWRASARSVQSGEEVRFATIEALFAFIEVQTTQTRQTRTGNVQSTSGQTDDEQAGSP